MPEAELSLQTRDNLYFLAERYLFQMYPVKKLVLLLLLIQQNAEIHTILPVKHDIMEKKHYLHAFITWHATIFVQSRWELALSWDLCSFVLRKALINSAVLRRGYATGVHHWRCPGATGSARWMWCKIFHQAKAFLFWEQLTFGCDLSLPSGLYPALSVYRPG